MKNHTQLAAPLSRQSSQVAIIKSETGQPLAVMPLHQYQQMEQALAENQTTLNRWILFSSMASIILFCFAVGLSAWMFGEVSDSNKPVVVEKPVVVDRGCILWCK